jgi:tight adherence protein B
MTPIIISIAAFIGVAAFVGGVAVMFRSGVESSVEDRLEVLTSNKTAAALEMEKKEKSLLARPLDDAPGLIEEFFSQFLNVRPILQQADVDLSPVRFIIISLGLSLAGAATAVFSGLPIWSAPLAGVCLAGCPLAWALFRRQSRAKAFAKQMPEALELVARALRAGHSLASGFQLVQSEMKPPISREFGRVFEEQNLGVPFEEALEHLAQRVSNMDLRFFVTAVVLQRQTGGDLAEILDKIGTLVRERFKIHGQIQALTGEGRLSGIVLLALPPVLFVTMLKLNREYVMMLFDDPMGQQMLAVGIILQVLGALVIRKIVNIKV